MFTDLFMDFLRRYWWGVIGVIVLLVGGIWWYNDSQKVEVSGYKISAEAYKAVEYYTNGEIDKAEAQYKTVVAKHPKDWFSWNGLGNIYRDHNLYGSAEEAYLKTLAINPKFEQAYRNIFNLYYSWSERDKDLTQLTKAEPILLQGLKSIPKSQSILEDLCTYYAQTNDQQKLQQYRAILDAVRNPQPQTKSNSILEPFISK
ncbi:MAG: tetratricopeptide repeat protein [Patescibacteria group bacterium]